MSYFCELNPNNHTFFMFLGGAFTFLIVLESALSFDAWLLWDEAVHMGAIKTYSSEDTRRLAMEGILEGFGINNNWITKGNWKSSKWI